MATALSLLPSAPASELSRRWLGKGGKVARAEALDALRRGETGGLDLRGIRLVDEDLRGVDFSGLDLSGADFSRAELEGAHFIGARLCHATLVEAKLDRTELAGADLRGATLDRARARETGFGGCDLRHASLFNLDAEDASFVEARLDSADLRALRGRGARLAGACLDRATLAQADLRDADLSRASVDRTVLLGADLRSAQLRGLLSFERASFLSADVRDVDWSGAYLVRRHIIDENFLHEFRSQGRAHRALYWLWWASSDCGRSLLRWTAWTALIGVTFGAVYASLPLRVTGEANSLTPYYFSLVTLTTLGYGDVLPDTQLGQAAVMVEVAIGYLMLGGLVSIFANKLARRGE